ncbi:MAG: putative DNA binding domain-containing protein [Hormoscilla sp. GUM202]|nr:putative DNA binding domain-containing protein [Hormoscilla sp. GUM202]
MQIENVHLLIVEDNPRYLNELLDWLDDFGYRQILSATSAKEAKEKLSDPFDVIIADMRMENDDSGFAVMDEVKARNLSSVVIILTANDTVKDCRTAFKKGAWDYISKSMRGNVFEALHESIKEAITYFNRWGNVHNEQWIDENLASLEREYFGQYIAVINKTVIESADTEAALQQRIEERKLRRFLTTIRKIGDLRPISELVKFPESSRLEFKSTYQWDVRQNCKNKDLKFSVLKTIAAFLNSEGGTLIIGVEDDGNIFGLEKDFSVMSKGNPDRFERDVMQLIKENIGAKFTQFVTVRFERVEGKDICAVEVRKSAPAFMKGKNGIEFYIRSGNASEPLDVKNLNDYL